MKKKIRYTTWEVFIRRLLSGKKVNYNIKQDNIKQASIIKK